MVDGTLGAVETLDILSATGPVTKTFFNPARTSSFITLTGTNLTATLAGPPAVTGTIAVSEAADIASMTDVVAATTTTWNPSDKDTDIALTNGNLTATSLSISRSAVRTIASASSGKVYWEISVNDVDLGGGQAIGIANSTFAVEATQLGEDGNSIGLYGDGGVQYAGAALGANVDPFTTGDVVSVALDIGNGKIWFRVNAGNWNANASANPATNTGGKTVSVTGALYAAVSLRFFGVGSSSRMTGNFGPTYTQSVPSGFGNL
jgi:hypothetical protein